MTDFSVLGLAEPLLRALKAEGHDTPTAIQSAAIPALLAGRDMLGTAQTGTGKTAAFALPLIHALATSPGRAKPRRPRALILAPTRELAAQIQERVQVYSRFTRLTTALVVGGAKPGPQVRALARGADILIATPGRLEDHLGTGAVRLEACATVVLDEADQMLDLGFLPAIRRLLASLPGRRQTVLLSATMPAPIRRLAKEFLRDPAEVAVAPAARPIEAIEQSVVLLETAAKREALVQRLGQPEVGRALVFTRTKRGADKVSQHLDKAGLAAAAIHGNKSQSQRERALSAFRSGKVPILVATDIAARGIDVEDVSHVVNYELPNVPEAYVHRIGRTARAGKSGIAVSLCDPSERNLLKDIERLIGHRLPGNDDRPAAKARRKATPAAGPTKGAKPASRRPNKGKAPTGSTAPKAALPRAQARGTQAAVGFTSSRGPNKGDFAMATGSVKWFNETKGYGFIAPDEGGPDVFVHITAVQKAGMTGLAEGQKIAYDIEVDERRGKSSAGNLRSA